MPCPRCHNKMFAKCTGTFTRILDLVCPKCAFKLDLELYRKALKSEYYNQPNPDEPDRKDSTPL